MANASHLFSYLTSLREVFFLISIFDFPQASIPEVACAIDSQKWWLYCTSKKVPMAKYQLTTESARLGGLRIAAMRDVAVNWAISSRANACLLAKICHSALTRKL